MKRILIGTAMALALTACSKTPEKSFEPVNDATTTSSSSTAATSTRPEASNALKITKLGPAMTTAGKAFHEQPNHQSAIAVEGENITRSTVINFAGQNLRTTFGGSTVVTALVPSDLIAKPGSYPVQLIDGDRKSETLTFTVKP